MPDDEVPDPIVSWTPDLSISLPNTDNASLDSVQLHDLAILRIHGKPGPVAMSLITMYLNKRYNHNWTVNQIVRVWRTLRQEIEKEDTIRAGHVIFLWEDLFEESQFEDREKRNLLEELLNLTIDQFFETMSSELEDSELDIDLDAERKAVDSVTVLTSVRENWTAAARGQWTEADTKLFSHDDGPTMFKHSNWEKDNQKLIDLANERIRRTRALEDATHKWKKEVAAGRNPGRKPSKWDEEFIIRFFGKENRPE
ncbi:MAG: hypothetical protein Q9166_005302 [cf. Caloplaca sp. 2 TL-2023]